MGPPVFLSPAAPASAGQDADEEFGHGLRDHFFYQKSLRLHGPRGGHHGIGVTQVQNDRARLGLLHDALGLEHDGKADAACGLRGGLG